MNNILVINKDVDYTSRDVVNILTKVFNTKKIGHTGTLDPIATGVLVCTIGKCTKLNEDITSEDKEYTAEFKLGILTDTLDVTGKILKQNDVIVDKEKVIDAINSFKGEYDQEVPLYSSVKVNGRKLYEYARNGEDVSLPKRKINIKEIEFLSCNDNIYKFRCVVSKGTYIRSLIRDIGKKLETYGCMVSLVRTRQGKFTIENSYTLSDVKNGNYKLLNIEDVLDILIIDANDYLYKEIFNGVKQQVNTDKNYILYKYQNEDICLYKKNNEEFEMYIKFL